MNTLSCKTILTRDDEYEDLLQLLLDHRCNDSQELHDVAHDIAGGCLGDNHLWQDMGLPNRKALSDMISRNFPSLYAKNSGDMKWKKFFYKQLCERTGVNACKAPRCGVCVDYSKCFGSEEV